MCDNAPHMNIATPAIKPPIMMRLVTKILLFVGEWFTRIFADSRGNASRVSQGNCSVKASLEIRAWSVDERHRAIAAAQNANRFPLQQIGRGFYRIGLTRY